MTTYRMDDGTVVDTTKATAHWDEDTLWGRAAVRAGMLQNAVEIATEATGTFSPAKYSAYLERAGGAGRQRFPKSEIQEKVTGPQWNHQTLYRSRKGRYYIEHTSQWQGSRPHVEWISPEEATRWLIHNDYELPEDLKHLEDEVTE